MDEIHEVTGTNPAELRDVTTERKYFERLVKTVVKAQGGGISQGNKVSLIM